ncbi:hypothetical protein ACHAW6_014419 [Cyclotella cf. meneghiniana]
MGLNCSSDISQPIKEVYEPALMIFIYILMMLKLTGLVIGLIHGVSKPGKRKYIPSFTWITPRMPLNCERSSTV